VDPSCCVDLGPLDPKLRSTRSISPAPTPLPCWSGSTASCWSLPTSDRSCQGVVDGLVGGPVVQALGSEWGTGPVGQGGQRHEGVVGRQRPQDHPSSVISMPTRGTLLKRAASLNGKVCQTYFFAIASSNGVLAWPSRMRAVPAT
jgi:hypothetical protein